MMYISTRDPDARVAAHEAIFSGISPEGGLFAPESFPSFSIEQIAAMAGMNYAERSFAVCSAFLDEFDKETLRRFISQAYSTFTHPLVTPLRKIDDGFYVCELFHGPTAAFKDVALQLLPHLLTESARMAGDGRRVKILTATSGDTGKAALEGFRDVPGTSVTVFYPHEGVSEIQRRQMSTQEGGNVAVYAVRGNFDDTQTGVKQIFTDPRIRAELEGRGEALSSANSINFGRLLPQLAYYFSAYADLLRDGVIKPGDKVDFTVPTGNFGNILAGYYAWRCGLPVRALVCASNKNNILTDFFTTGVYDTKRPFYLTTSPSMDILISSNLERLLFELVGRDAGAVRGMMRDLAQTGRYELGEGFAARAGLFYAGCCPEEKVRGVIGETFKRRGYVMDPHTAVGGFVAAGHMEKNPGAVNVLMATASPYKFCGTVLEALGQNVPQDPFDALRTLEEISGVPVPAGLAELEGKPERFADVIDIGEMRVVARR